MNYKQAIEYVAARRRDDEANALAFYKRLMTENARFHDVETSLRKAEMDLARGKVALSAVEPLRLKREALIDELGVRDKIYPPYRCSLCRDTGLGADGKPCKCAASLTVAGRTDNIELPLHDFSQVDLSLFGENAPSVSRTVFALQTLAERGENANRKNINLLGKTGTGKTFLASCFASECLRRGRTVVFVTAFSFVRRALDYHTAFAGDKADGFTPLIDADVLVIDDLGTESTYKNVTLEYLYHVVNERQIHGKTTVITSNLSGNEIAAKYGERISSRLFDAKLCYAMFFDFPDIRIIKA